MHVCWLTSALLPRNGYPTAHSTFVWLRVQLFSGWRMQNKTYVITHITAQKHQNDAEKYKWSNLYFNIVDVRCEAEGDFGVVCVVFTVSNCDAHINLVRVWFDNHSPGWKQSACLAVILIFPHKGAVMHWKDLKLATLLSYTIQYIKIWYIIFVHKRL